MWFRKSGEWRNIWEPELSGSLFAPFSGSNLGAGRRELQRGALRRLDFAQEAQGCGCKCPSQGPRCSGVQLPLWHFHNFGLITCWPLRSQSIFKKRWQTSALHSRVREFENIFYNRHMIPPSENFASPCPQSRVLFEFPSVFVYGNSDNDCVQRFSRDLHAQSLIWCHLTAHIIYGLVRLALTDNMGTVRRGLAHSVCSVAVSSVSWRAITIMRNLCFSSSATAFCMFCLY